MFESLLPTYPTYTAKQNPQNYKGWAANKNVVTTNQLNMLQFLVIFMSNNKYQILMLRKICVIGLKSYFNLVCNLR